MGAVTPHRRATHVFFVATCWLAHGCRPSSIAGPATSHVAVEDRPFSVADGGRPTAASAPERSESASVRGISWQDRVYDFGGGERYSFSNGSYSARSEDDQCEVCLQIRATSFGDVDFDGREEAIVLVSWNLGGASTIINGYIFSLEQGAVILRGEIEGGDRANGGLASVAVADGQVLVSRFGGDSACCPSEVVIERWRWSSDKLVRQAGETIEPRDEKPWYLQR